MKLFALRIVRVTFFLFLPTLSLCGAEWSLLETEEGYEIRLDDKLFAGYRVDFKGTPIIWPVIGPTGREMTRSYPMNPQGKPSEKIDHEHHRSIWFDHGDVNGEDYWKITASTIRHKRFIEAKKKDDGVVLVTENEWVDKSGKTICTDRRTIRFGLLGETRVIDFDVTVAAAVENVVFGDTKEGSFGVRVPGRFDSDKKRRDPSHHGGTIVNAEGLRNDAAWGKRSSWVDYYGELENGDLVGIAILNHPESFRYPTYWHVRTYGLFAANPFGVHDFVKGENPDAGKLVLEKKGDSFTLRYRLLFHKGTTTGIDLPKCFEEYSKQ